MNFMNQTEYKIHLIGKILLLDCIALYIYICMKLKRES